MKLFFKILGRSFAVVFLLSIGLTLFSLLAPEDTDAKTISGDYALVKENSRSTYIINTQSGEQVIPSIIISYSDDQNFIAAKQTEVPPSDVKPDYTTYSYWLINTTSGEITGPLAKEADFTAFCSQYGLTFDEWLGT